MFIARWVDDPKTSRTRVTPSMFAAASDTAVGRVVEFKAVIQNYSMFTFDVTSVYTHAWEDGLVFLEPPPVEIEEHGDCVWRSIRVIFGRRKGVRSWQEHFDSIFKSEEARQRGFTVELHPKCPTLYHAGETDELIELHVGDRHGCGKETIVAELFAFLSEKIEMKYVQGVWSGSYEYLKTMKVRDEKKLTSIPNKKYLQSALNELEMGDCRRGLSPKLDKARMIGLSAYSVVSQQRENGHSKHGAFSVYETEKSNSVGDATIEANIEIRQGHRRHGDSVRSACQQRQEGTVGQETGSLHRL